eukprot:4709756-Pyramimonas_sp.AAC.1
MGSLRGYVGNARGGTHPEIGPSAGPPAVVAAPITAPVPARRRRRYSSSIDSLSRACSRHIEAMPCTLAGGSVHKAAKMLAELSNAQKCPPADSSAIAVDTTT